MTTTASKDGITIYTQDNNPTWKTLNINASIADIHCQPTIEFDEAIFKPKTPEVREDQRSALKITKRVVANFYKNGFYTDFKDLMPAIKSIDVFNGNTVKMTFVNGDIQTSTAKDGDTFSLEHGLLMCMMKEIIGKEGGAILNKLVAYATKTYETAETNKKKKAEEMERQRNLAAKKAKKAQRRWEKRQAKARERRVQEMVEAIVRTREIERNV